jgi:hypothetical protein
MITAFFLNPTTSNFYIVRDSHLVYSTLAQVGQSKTTYQKVSSSFGKMCVALNFSFGQFLAIDLMDSPNTRTGRMSIRNFAKQYLGKTI